MHSAHRLLIIVLFSVSTIHAYAQKKEIEAGDRFYEDFLYPEAIQQYQAALSMTLTPKAESYVIAQLARCHQYSFQYTYAETYYEELVSKLGDEKPEFILELAIMQKFNGKYEESKNSFKRYQKLTEFQDPYGAFHLRSVNWAIANDTVYKPVLIYPTNLDISGQSLGFTFFEKGVIYAHARNKEPYFSMPIFDLDYAIRKDSISFEELTNLVDSIVFSGNEGFPSFNAQTQKLYFAANASLDKKTRSRKTAEGKEYILNFNIYEATYRNGYFSEITPLSFNGADYNCTHPFITPDDNTLYFTSDMPGGIGGYDLYIVRKDKFGKWGEPQNLGKSVNSEEHELFPYIYQGRLYYSSKGLNGYGGYDIYTALLNKFGTASSPQNMGKPYNSFRDDYAYSCYENGFAGYFSSNRSSDEGNDIVYYFREYPALPKKEAAQLNKTKLDSLNKAQDAVLKQNIIEEQAKKETLPPPPPPPPIEPPPVVLPVAVAVVIPESPKVQQDTSPVPTKDTLVIAKPETQAQPTVMVAPQVVDTPTETYVDPDESLLKLVFSNVNFGFNETKLVSEVLHILDSAAATIRAGNKIKVEIAAHTDSRGTSVYNKELSLKRANEARTYLLSKGVPASKIVIRGYGEDKLLNGCGDGVECTEEEHAVNRRVELRIFN